LIQNSNAISAYFFNGVGVINSATSPQGINNAFSFDVNNGVQGGLSPITITTTAQSYTFSVYLKGSVNGQKVRLFGDLNGAIQDFTLTTEWARYTKTFTGAIGPQSIYLLNGSYFSPSQNDLYFGYGMQLEVGSYATSLIPTNGTSVTRNADVIEKTGISSLIGQAEGTMFFDGIVNNIQNSATNILNTNKNPSINSQIALVKEKNTNKIKFQQFFGNGTFDSITLNATNTFANGTRTKVAIRYKSGDFAMYINGNLEATSSLTFTNIGTKTELFLNDIQTIYAYQESVSFNAVALWKSPLTNTQLAELTTL
jgi:hypothetical protein